MKPLIYKFSLVIFTLSIFTFFTPAQTMREKGMELYRQGKDSEAINLLKSASKTNKKDAEIWNYLGLAYINTDKFKDARKSLEKAVKFSPQSAVYRTNLAYACLLDRKINKAQSEVNKAISLDSKNANAYFVRATTYLWERKFDKTIADSEKAIELNKDFTDAYILKSDGLLYSFGQEWQEESEPAKSLYLLENAVALLKNCLGKCLNERGSKLVKERLETVEGFIDHFNRKKDENSDSANLTEKTPIKFISKLPPSYTDAARQANEEGKVILAILFGADGQIKHIIVLEGLKYGLTEQAIAAARKITFEPEKINGKPISVVKRVQYTFDIY